MGDNALASFPSWKWQSASKKRGVFPVYKINGRVLNVYDVVLRSKYRGDRSQLARLREGDWGLLGAKKQSRLRNVADAYYEEQLRAARKSFLISARHDRAIREKAIALANSILCASSLTPEMCNPVGPPDPPHETDRTDDTGDNVVVPEDILSNDAAVPCHLDPLPEGEKMSIQELAEALSRMRCDAERVAGPIAASAACVTSQQCMQELEAGTCRHDAAGESSRVECYSDDNDASNFPHEDGGVVDLRPLPNEYRPEEFAEADITEDPLGFIRTKLKFSEVFMDWVISEDIPREVAMRFIRTLKQEHAEYDLPRMPLCWESLTKLTTAKLRRIAPIMEVVNSKGEVVTDAEYFYLGVRNQIRTRLWRLLAATFPDGSYPRRPHFFVELWTDGVPLNRSGNANELWPVSCSIIAVGENWTSTHRYVPPSESQPFTVAMYLAPTKPEDGEMILSDVVREILSLDPRDPGNARFIDEDAGFSVTLRSFAGDLPAIATVKSVYGHTSGRPCFKCRVKGHIITGVGEGIQIFEIMNFDLREDKHFLQYDEHVIRVSSTPQRPS